ncbi:MAG: stage sporulation protein [Clostridiales bacterium]|nr:stage sporulation protein [Clostridiales bacterium]
MIIGNEINKRYGWKESLLDFMPMNIRTMLNKIPSELSDKMEEIRMRVNKPLMLISANRDYMLDEAGYICSDPKQAYKVSKLDIDKTLQFMSEYSLYAIEEELRNGYITLAGGYRVGVVGKAVMAGSAIRTIKYISGLNIRIGRELIGVADKVMRFIIDNDAKPLHTLVVSPPQCGKTTLLRDIARQFSDGCGACIPRKVVIVDERSELAGSYMGIAQNDVGIRTDVLDACPKAAGIMMAIRAMSPDVIVTDEIGRQEDVYAIEEALNSGIIVVASAHGKDISDISNRPILKQLMDKRIFQRYVILGRSLGTGTIEGIYDGYNHNALLAKPMR